MFNIKNTFPCEYNMHMQTLYTNTLLLSIPQGIIGEEIAGNSISIEAMQSHTSHCQQRMGLLYLHLVQGHSTCLFNGSCKQSKFCICPDMLAKMTTPICDGCTINILEINCCEMTKSIKNALLGWYPHSCPHTQE